MRRTLFNRIEKLEAPFKPVSIFADWCLARNPGWSESDYSAFSEWIDFMMGASPEQMNDANLNPDVEFSGSFASNRGC